MLDSEEAIFTQLREDSSARYQIVYRLWNTTKAASGQRL